MNNKFNIGHLLDDDQRSLLTKNASTLSKEEIQAMQSDPSLGGKLNKDDRASLRKLAMHRAKSGQTVLTFSHMSLDTDNHSAKESDDDDFESNW